MSAPDSWGSFEGPVNLSGTHKTSMSFKPGGQTGAIKAYGGSFHSGGQQRRLGGRGWGGWYLPEGVKRELDLKGDGKEAQKPVR